MSALFTPKLICLDCDFTLITESSWRALNLAFGVLPAEDDMLVDWGENNIIDDQTGQNILANLYKERSDPTRDKLEAAISKLTLAEDGLAMVESLKGAGYELVIISVALDAVVRSVARRLGIANWNASNQIVYDGDRLDAIVTVNNEQTYKMNMLRTLCRERGITETDCLVVASGNSDKLIFEASQHGVCRKGSPLEGGAWQVVDDFLAVAGLLGKTAN